MQKGNGPMKLSGNIILTATKPVSCVKNNIDIKNNYFSYYLFSFIQQQPISNIPTHKPSNNFQQTLPRYNPPPNPLNSNNPARRIQQKGRYSTGTATSLIPSPGIHQTPLASPALSTTSTAVSAPENSQKSHLQYPSRIPDMLKFQVRKSETESTNTNQQNPPNSATTHTSTNAQIQVT